MRVMRIVPLRLLLTICIAFGVACTSESPVSQPAGPAGSVATLFEGARLIVGDGGAVIESSAFLVEGARFTAVGTSGELVAPDGATRVDLTGKTVMPAMVDLHSHLGFVNEADGTQAKENFTRENLQDHLERFAYAGHAATVSFGTDFPQFIWQMREASQQDAATGARYLTVGRGLAWPGSGPFHPARNDVPYPVVSEWQARVAVRELAAKEVDFLKIWVDDRNETQTKITPPIYEAAIDEARIQGLRPVAHVYDLDDAKGLIRAGIEGFTHMVRDQAVDDELLALLRERPEVWFTPNLGGPSRRTIPGERAAWLQDPLLGALMSADEIEGWGQRQESSTGQSEMRRWDGENTATLHAAGVRLALGSDSAGGTRTYGWSSHGELENFVVEGGMTTGEVIIAATSLPGEILGLDIGTVAAGQSADFLVLDANPLEDISNTRRISEVYLRGKAVDRAAMKARWEAAGP